jgi:transposase
MRPKGSSAALEQRRRSAMAMLKEGMEPTAVGKALHVSVVSVGRWRKALREGGAKALAAVPVPGRPPKLDPARHPEIARLLLRGPAHYGFATQLWTLVRIAEVVERHLGVDYHPSQLWRILSSMGWSCQKPESRARERDEQAIARWKKSVWPRIKKSRQHWKKRALPG